MSDPRTHNTMKELRKLQEQGKLAKEGLAILKRSRLQFRCGSSAAGFRSVRMGRQLQPRPR